MDDPGKVEVYELRGHYFVVKDGELFELTDDGPQRIEYAPDKAGPAMVDLGPLMFALPSPPVAGE